MRNKIIILLVGALCNLAFAPFHFFPAAIISLSVFYFFLEENDERKSTFWLGFFYGFGYFLAGIYWISISLLVDAEKFAWLIPFALTLIPAALALYVALFAISYKFFTKKFKLAQDCQKILVFTLCWLGFEILRSHLFTGFPWNLIGYSWMFSASFTQLASIFGIYGLSAFAILACLLPVIFWKNFGVKKLSEVTCGDKIFALSIILFLFSAFIFGQNYVDEKKIVSDPQTKLRLVQANIKQEMKWDGAQKYRNFLKHVELTNSQSLDGVKAVIWSETSTPYVIDDNPDLLKNLSFAVPLEGSLITGGLRLDRRSGEDFDVWNSIFVINKTGVTAHYDKHHLVPFGEYVPLQKFLPFVEKITGGASGFSRGDGAKTLLTNNFSFSPLLCYEVIFSNEVVDKNHRPDLLVNLTNDAWFGSSSGPYQHLDMAKMRAIEQGTALVRVAGTGVTAFIDPFGRVVAEIKLNQEGILDVDFIKNLTPTIYERFSYLPLILLTSAMFAFLSIPLLTRNDSRQNHTN